MNIHPLVVHFPIGLLVAYSILELAATLFTHIRNARWFFSLKTALLFAGTLGALLSLVTGGMAEEFAEATYANAFVVEAHAPVAGVTTLVFAVLAAAHLVRLFDRRGWGNRIAGFASPFLRIWNYKKYAAHIVLDTWALPVLAALGFAGILIAGALGTAIVYGPDTDPFVSFVFHLFWAP